MKALVIYDSTYGNTQRIAEIIAKELDAPATSVTKITPGQLKDYDTLIVGSPINGWKPSENMGVFLENLNDNELQGIKATTFDTRVKIFIHGDAMKKISAALKQAGAEIFTEPHAFYVKGSEGPLLDGEIEEATAWAKRMKSER